MTLKNLVVSTETANKLKAVGWNKPTMFAWLADLKNTSSFLSCVDGGKIGLTVLPTEKYDDVYAPTAEEILRELPSQIYVKGAYFLTIGKHKDGTYTISYDDNTAKDFVGLFESQSLSGAAAQMWLWCKMERYIK